MLRPRCAQVQHRSLGVVSAQSRARCHAWLVVASRRAPQVVSTLAPRDSRARCQQPAADTFAVVALVQVQEARSLDSQAAPSRAFLISIPSRSDTVPRCRRPMPDTRSNAVRDGQSSSDLLSRWLQLLSPGLLLPDVAHWQWIYLLRHR
jgi:hypothetical protein